MRNEATNLMIEEFKMEIEVAKRTIERLDDDIKMFEADINKKHQFIFLTSQKVKVLEEMEEKLNE